MADINRNPAEENEEITQSINYEGDFDPVKEFGYDPKKALASGFSKEANDKNLAILKQIHDEEVAKYKEHQNYKPSQEELEREKIEAQNASRWGKNKSLKGIWDTSIDKNKLDLYFDPGDFNNGASIKDAMTGELIAKIDPKVGEDGLYKGELSFGLPNKDGKLSYEDNGVPYTGLDIHRKFQDLIKAKHPSTMSREDRLNNAYKDVYNRATANSGVLPTQDRFVKFGKDIYSHLSPDAAKQFDVGINNFFKNKHDEEESKAMNMMNIPNKKS